MSVRRSHAWFALSGSLLLAALCFICHERHLSGRDSSNFLLAIRHGYSISEQRPHAPGYPAFYVVWSSLKSLTAFSPHTILLVTNAAFAIVAFLLTVVAVRKWMGEKPAIIAGLLMLTNPLLLYFANTTELYAYDAAYSAFLIWLFIANRSRFWPFMIYGLLASFRLSSFMLTLPAVVLLVVVSAWDARSWKAALLPFCGIVAGYLLWFIPFVMTLGGWRAFQHMMAIAQGFPAWAPLQNALTITMSVFWTLNILAVVLIATVVAFFKRVQLRDRSILALCLLLLVPGSFFAVRYTTKGYTLLCLAPAVALAVWAIAHSTRPRMLLASALGLNLLIFFVAPFLAPPARSALSHAVRTTQERVTSALLRGTSAYLPSNSHLRATDAAASDILRLIDGLPLAATIFVDRAAASWMHGRCVATERPQFTILGVAYEPNRFERYRDGTIEVISEQQIDSSAPFYLLTERELSLEFTSVLLPVSGRGRFMLFSIPVDKRADFFHRIDSLYADQ